MPFRSKSQARLFFAKEDRGELPKGTAQRWAAHTPSIKALPEHVDDKEKDKTASAFIALLADRTKAASASTVSAWLARLGGKIPGRLANPYVRGSAAVLGTAAGGAMLGRNIPRPNIWPFRDAGSPVPGPTPPISGDREMAMRPPLGQRAGATSPTPTPASEAAGPLEGGSKPVGLSGVSPGASRDRGPDLALASNASQPAGIVGSLRSLVSSGGTGRPNINAAGTAGILGSLASPGGLGALNAATTLPPGRPASVPAPGVGKGGGPGPGELPPSRGEPGAFAGAVTKGRGGFLDQLSQKWQSLHPTVRTLLLGGGGAAGAYGLYKLLTRGKKRREEDKEASALSPLDRARALVLGKRLALTKSASLLRKNAQVKRTKTAFVCFLTRLAGEDPALAAAMEKVRTKKREPQSWSGPVNKMRQGMQSCS